MSIRRIRFPSAVGASRAARHPSLVGKLTVALAREVEQGKGGIGGEGRGGVERRA